MLMFVSSGSSCGMTSFFSLLARLDNGATDLTFTSVKNHPSMEGGKQGSYRRMNEYEQKLLGKALRANKDLHTLRIGTHAVVKPGFRDMLFGLNVAELHYFPVYWAMAQDGMFWASELNVMLERNTTIEDLHIGEFDSMQKWSLTRAIRHHPRLKTLHIHSIRDVSRLEQNDLARALEDNHKMMDVKLLRPVWNGIGLREEVQNLYPMLDGLLKRNKWCVIWVVVTLVVERGTAFGLKKVIDVLGGNAAVRVKLFSFLFDVKSETDLLICVKFASLLRE
jgi:DNA-binding transcriptional regulator YiaG